MSKPVAYRWKSDLGYIYDVFNHGDGEPLYTHPVKQLSDEDLKLLKKVINDCAGNIEYRIDIERLAFKGYEHCSELESLYEEQKDANRAIAIIKEITE